MRVFLLILAFSLSCGAGAESIKFLCSWDDKKPIEIVVKPQDGTATRSDGGRNYKVVKITKWVVWLMIDEPENVAGMAIQMIQRSEAVEGKAGKWVDVVFSVTGSVSPIEGGVCWESSAGA